MKVACWSGPRNISTALMRSWSSRDDTYISDEPFYAHYLKKKKLKHPMYKEIINEYPNNFNEIVNNLLGSNPENKKIWYQKHMSHHLLNTENLQWISNLENCVLIRHPKQVINSYLAKNKLKDVNELGYPQQFKIIEFLKNEKKPFLVIDSQDIIENPKKFLTHWCNFLGIDFQNSMLRWKKGNHENDGIWWKHWYDNVVNSTKFEKRREKDYKTKFSKKNQLIYDSSMEYYEELLYYTQKEGVH